MEERGRSQEEGGGAGGERERLASARSRLDSLADALAARRERDGQRDAMDGELSPEPLERLLEISRAMNRIHDRDALLSCVGDGLRELFDAENSFLILFGEDGSPRVHSAHRGQAAGDPAALSDTILKRVRETKVPVWVDDVASRPDLSQRESVERFKIASVLCAPLLVGEQVIGALQFDHRGAPQPFTRSDMRLLALFADHVATALSNVQLIAWLNKALAEVQAAKERAVQAERLSALGEMATGIAHDFNNTLFVALGFCDVLLAKSALEPEVRNALERIRTCALDAASTVRRLQVFARGRAGDDRRVVVDPNAIVAEMPEFTRHKWLHEARRRSVVVAMETRLEPVPAVRADPSELREVLTNLIFNAVDAMERDGVIELATGAVEQRVFLSVRDQGAGIPPELLTRIFDPFFTTKGARGSGLGLPACWSIARRLDGEIVVESQEGIGSVFTLWLPAADDGPRASSRPRTDQRRSLDVLVIDDDPEVLETTRLLVEALGHRVSADTDARAALARLEPGRFDLVLTDLGMPRLDGADVVHEVRRLDPDVPIVILSGWGADLELDARLAGCVAAVLAKPITLEALGTALAKALRSTR